MTELATYQPQTDVAAQMQWAQAVVARQDGSAQSILPEAYRNNPANVLIAVGLGASMGLSFAESLYRISVIKGKPSAAAELIAANVRKAGHKLRIQVTENPPSATCTIIRADDPDYPIVITRDMAWAQRMGLTGEANYKKQPSTMLSYRAITACARLACPEALYGVTYTPDEAASIEDGAPAPTPAKSPGVAGLRAAVTPNAGDVREPDPSEPVTTNDEPVDAEEVTEDEPKLTKREQGKLFALFAQKGIPEAEQRSGIEAIIGHPIPHRTTLTGPEFDAVIARLETLPDAGQ